MKIVLVKDMVNDTPTTKKEMYRLTEPFSFLRAKVVKEYEFKRGYLIDSLLWFDSIEKAEKYLEKL